MLYTLCYIQYTLCYILYAIYFMLYTGKNHIANNIKKIEKINL